MKNVCSTLSPVVRKCYRTSRDPSAATAADGAEVVVKGVPVPIIPIECRGSRAVEMKELYLNKLYLDDIC